jgi:prolyl-tRNA synthetase
VPEVFVDVEVHGLQGVPIRLELGSKDMEGQVAVLARRDTGVKETVAWADVATRVPALLEEIYVSALYFIYVIISITH